MLRQFDATEGFDMIPEAKLTRQQWFWLVGETQMLKESYRHINPEAFEICYEAMIQQIVEAKEAGLKPEAWPNMASDEPAQFVLRAGYRGPLKPHGWALQRDVQRELLRQLMQEGDLATTATSPT